MCSSDFSIAYGGRSDVITHVRGKHHRSMADACSSRSLTSFFRPTASQGVIQAEALWVTFVAEHDLALGVFWWVWFVSLK